jgi:hypothetical protein
MKTALEVVMDRLVKLEQQVANQAVELHKWASPITLKSQAAQAQAMVGGLNDPQMSTQVQQNHLYAPLRSDTKPLLEMSAFVRKVANFSTDISDRSAWYTLHEIAEEAQDILKRST